MRPAGVQVVEEVDQDDLPVEAAEMLGIEGGHDLALVALEALAHGIQESGRGIGRQGREAGGRVRVGGDEAARLDDAERQLALHPAEIAAVRSP
jgi:hypothetical protein